MQHTRRTISMIVLGTAAVAVGCDRLDLPGLLEELEEGHHPPAYDAGAPTPHCEPTRVPPPPPGVDVAPCPPLDGRCTASTLWCTLDGRLAVLGCDESGGIRIIGIDGQITCDDPEPPPPTCHLPPPPANYEVRDCPPEGSLCREGLPLWCTIKGHDAMMNCREGRWQLYGIDGVGTCP